MLRDFTAINRLAQRKRIVKELTSIPFDLADINVKTFQIYATLQPQNLFPQLPANNFHKSSLTQRVR